MKDIQNKGLQATKHYSGLEIAHDTYNGISPASDGRIYYVLSSNTLEGGKMYRFDPKTESTELLADLTEICGEGSMRAIPQGKSHSALYEKEGKLYLATHIGYYEMIDNFERLPVTPPEGYALYPGGHILSYDLASGEFEDLAIAPDKGGLVTMSMDTERGQVYGITWPQGRFIHYDIQTRQLRDLGKLSASGEAGKPGEDYRVLCRSIVIDPRDGAAYASGAEGTIWKYDWQEQVLSKMKSSLKRDYFGVYDITRPGSMGYNWRQVAWYEPEGVCYGVHGNSGYLFRFDPQADSLELVDRITSAASQKIGMYDQFTYGYLGFAIGGDGHTIYYLTGGPVFEDGRWLTGDGGINVGSRGTENLHLVTYHIPTRGYQDHGPIFFADGSRPSYVNSIALSDTGRIYTMGRYEHEGLEISDLFSIPDPLINT